VQRRDRVEVRLAILVVDRRPPLRRLGHQRGIHAPLARVVRDGGHGEFERVQREAGVAVGEVDQLRQRLVIQGGVVVAEAAIAIDQRPLQQATEIVVAERLQDEDA
jgi:hypothetical protein